MNNDPIWSSCPHQSYQHNTRSPDRQIGGVLKALSHSKTATLFVASPPKISQRLVTINAAHLCWPGMRTCSTNGQFANTLIEIRTPTNQKQAFMKAKSSEKYMLTFYQIITSR